MDLTSQISSERIDELVTPIVRLIPHLANRVWRRFPIHNPDVDDLISVGNLAIVMAAHRYSDEHESGSTFPNFAFHYVQGAMVGSVLRPEGRRPTSGKVFWSNLEDALNLTANNSLELSFFWREVRSALTRALGQLPIEQREVIVMRYTWDMSPGEIASRLKEKPANIAKRHRTALKTLREITPGLFHASLKEKLRPYPCPDCNSENTGSSGRSGSGAKAYRCRDCKKRFVANPVSRKFEDHRYLKAG